MMEHYEIAKQIRDLLRRADKFGYDLQTLKEEVLRMAELQEKIGEAVELQMIIEAQRFHDDTQVESA